jgi:hypothetical protein
MATTYNVTIIELMGAPSLEGATNVVTSVNYKVQGVADDGTEAIHYDGISCTYDADNFTPFADLTEDQVKGWVTGSATYDSICAYVDVLIEAIQTPTNVSMENPW